MGLAVSGCARVPSTSRAASHPLLTGQADMATFISDMESGLAETVEHRVEISSEIPKPDILDPLPPSLLLCPARCARCARVSGGTTRRRQGGRTRAVASKLSHQAPTEACSDMGLLRSVSHGSMEHSFRSQDD